MDFAFLVLQSWFSVWLINEKRLMLEERNLEKKKQCCIGFFFGVGC